MCCENLLDFFSSFRLEFCFRRHGGRGGLGVSGFSSSFRTISGSNCRLRSSRGNDSNCEDIEPFFTS